MNNAPAQNNSARRQSIAAGRNIIQSLKTKTDAKRSTSEKLADWITSRFGSMSFLAINVIWFAVWLIVNTGIIPGIEPFDPFPFGLLTTIVSLEAIILAIFVLISENRAAKIADLREEVDLQVDITTESELTKLLVMMKLLLEKNGIDISDDPELEAMLQPTDTEQIEEALEEQVVKQG
ncbi:MAG: DUF1003 domain-containing protein [Anaerolineae bacterium]|nr:DUF1003 domain-containing protein [Anaerolineae bacterium]